MIYIKLRHYVVGAKRGTFKNCNTYRDSNLLHSCIKYNIYHLAQECMYSQNFTQTLKKEQSSFILLLFPALNVTK